MTRPKFTQGGPVRTTQSVAVGPLYLVARRESASVYSRTLQPAIGRDSDARNTKEAMRTAVEMARRIVAEWSSQLDQLAEDCK